MQTFVALDFETANGNRASACEIGLRSLYQWQARRIILYAFDAD